MKYNFVTKFKASGDQPAAIAKLTEGVKRGERDQVLLGVTGSGKTFTMANIIANTGKPALIMAHNKTLAAQLYEEFCAFFPNNSVHYFVSYYDYYQPEAYVARSDTYIEKTSSINEEIDRMRHAATRALLEDKNVVIVASVSCIYGIGDPESYATMVVPIEVGDTVEREVLLQKLAELQYERKDMAFERGSFRVGGEVVDIYPSHLEDIAWRITFFDDEVEEITSFDPLTGKKEASLNKITIYPNSHYVVPRPKMLSAYDNIKEELAERLPQFERAGKLLEAQRLKERTMYDLEMIKSIGYCNGIENYSRHLSGRKPGEAPPTLFDYLPDDALLFVDESHVTVPQIGGMFKGDRARKQNLVDFGFRLPSALDNRPMMFEEWDAKRPQTIYVSATPSQHEKDLAKDNIAEQIVRPTGLVDPQVEIRPVENQVDDLMAEIHKINAKGYRTLVTTLTKRMAEQLTEYLTENGIKVRYMHSDIETIERSQIVRDLRLGVFDVLVGINLLREGLDIPEVGCVAILDADKEGFLRSTTSLIQTVGRAARNVDGIAIMYADNITKSMKEALDESNRRRAIQLEYNKKHNITPKSVTREIKDGLQVGESASTKTKAKPSGKSFATEKQLSKEIEVLKKEMLKAADNLDFENAAILRDRLKELEHIHLGV